MAYSYVSYPSQSGTVRDYAVPFGYLSRSHVRATVGGKTTSFSWVNDGLIRFATAPQGTVVIRRSTPVDKNYITFSDGSTYSARKQNTLALQHLYIAQELRDTGGSGGTSTGGGPVYENLYFSFYRPFPEQIERIVLTGPIQLHSADYTCDVLSKPTKNTTYAIRENGNSIGSLTINTNGTHKLTFLRGATHDVRGRVIDIVGPLNIDSEIAFGITLKGTGSVF